MNGTINHHIHDGYKEEDTMKRLLALTIVLAFVVGSPVFVLAEGPYRNASEFCKDYNDLGESHGKCVSIVENLFNRGNADVVGICKVWELLCPESFYEQYDNLGQCISDLRTADD